MKQTKILAILLALALLLTGCAQLVDLTQRLAENRDEQLEQLARQGKTREPFSQMTYTRPDMEAFQALAEESCRLGQTSEDVDQILEQTTQLYEAYDRFYTMLSLADIYYCKDLSNAEAQAEYEFCTGQSGQVEQALEAYYQALAQGPAVEELEEYFGEGFFDGYTGESQWDAAFLDLWNQEQEAVARYYEAMNQLADASYEDMEKNLGPILVELIGLRQELAAQVGYDDCEEFLWDGPTPPRIWMRTSRRSSRSWCPCTGRCRPRGCMMRCTGSGMGRASAWPTSPQLPKPWAAAFRRPTKK